MTKDEIKTMVCDQIDKCSDIIRVDFQKGISRLDYDGRPYELDPNGSTTIRIELLLPTIDQTESLSKVNYNPPMKTR